MVIVRGRFSLLAIDRPALDHPQATFALRNKCIVVDAQHLELCMWVFDHPTACCFGTHTLSIKDIYASHEEHD
ncbi:hypothetical protein KC342_g34 [Hortaea werneckii]|nr:hypothetical protein KC342_g34 [Hortaea werneckii]